MFMHDFDNFNEKCRGWKRFYLIADDIGKWFLFRNLCRLSCLYYDFKIICFFSIFWAYLLVFVLAVFSPSRESDGWAKWRLALLWCIENKVKTACPKLMQEVTDFMC